MYKIYCYRTHVVHRAKIKILLYITQIYIYARYEIVGRKTCEELMILKTTALKH